MSDIDTSGPVRSRGHFWPDSLDSIVAGGHEGPMNVMSNA